MTHFAHDAAENFNAVRKFGRNTAVGTTEEDIWALGALKTFPNVAATIYISSTDELNDVGIEITVEYLDADGSDKTVVGYLDGTNARTFVSLGVTALDVNRAYLSGDSEALTGTVYISNDNTDVGGDGIPDSLTNVLATIPPADGQTMQAMFQVPHDRIGFFKSYGFSVNSLTASQVVYVRVVKKVPGGSWRTVESAGIQSGESWHRDFHFSETLPGGTIVKLMAYTSTGSANVSGHFAISMSKEE